MEIFMLDTCTCTSTTSVCPIFSSYGDIFIQYHLKKQQKKHTHKDAREIEILFFFH